MHEILATAMVLRARKDRGVRFYLTWCLEFKNGIFQVTCIYLKKQRFWYNGTCLYLKYAVLTSKMSSWVKSDPPILTGSRKRSWSQNLRSISKNKDLVTQCTFQKVWKIALVTGTISGVNYIYKLMIIRFNFV